MTFSFSSFFTIMFFSSILIVLSWLLLKNIHLTKQLGIKPLFLCMVAVILRLLIPIEFSFTNNIALHGFYTKIIFFFNETTLSIFGIYISVADMLLIIWLMVALIILFKSIICFILFDKRILSIPKTSNVKVYKALQRVLLNYDYSVDFKIVQAKIASSPFIYGVYRPKIVIPDIELSEDEWYYILCHETAHYYHGDLLVKIVNELLCIIYWWNPFVYMLKKQLSKTIEIHTDLNATKSMTGQEKVEYLECLLKIAKKHIKTPAEMALTFNNGNSCTLVQRFHIVLGEDNTEPKFKLKGIFTIIPTILLLAASFLYVFEPYYISPETESSSIELTNQNTYLVKNQDNGYDIYCNDQYFGSINKIIDDFLQLPVYNNLKEVHNK